MENRSYSAILRLRYQAKIDMMKINEVVLTATGMRRIPGGIKFRHKPVRRTIDTLSPILQIILSVPLMPDFRG